MPENAVPPRREERDHERTDRNLSELLGELRVALPGVQVLFAFLLVVPFNSGFSDLSPFEEKVYFGTLLCAAAACACLIAPSAHHRVEFRLRDKEYIVLLANKLMIVGLGFLAIAMAGAILLVTSVIFGAQTAVVTAGLVAAAFAALWYGVPLRRRILRRRGGEAPAER
jgi:peptidoglycan/LPS O-acetylase OafA/YrhL